MRLFKKLFPHRESPPPSIDPTAALFDAAWKEALQRFEQVTGVQPLDLTILDPHTRKERAPHAAVGETFAQWQGLSAEYDRRGLLFDKFFSIVNDAMNAWQMANYAVATCRADVALSMLEQCQPPDPTRDDYEDHCAACARALLALTRYEEGLMWARRAAEAGPESGLFQTLLADALHLNGGTDAAHAIYSTRLASVQQSQAEQTGAVDEMFRQVFDVTTGVLPSPVLAISIGRSLANEAQVAEFWPRAETEFYGSPYFREQYAYWLMDGGHKQRSFEKLLALVEQMPWLRSASQALLRLLRQSDPNAQYLVLEFRAELEERVRQNGWSED